MHIKIYGSSILCNEMKEFLMLIIDLNYIHEFNVLTYILCILSKKKMFPTYNFTMLMLRYLWVWINLDFLMMVHKCWFVVDLSFDFH
jgi:hypothetical protein